MAVDTAQPVVTTNRRWWTPDEYHRMAEAGILHKDDRVELIDGEITTMSPIGSRHIACVNRLSKLLERRIGETTIVQVQSSIRLNDYSEPQPDIAVLRLRADYYADFLPTPPDVLLVMEVADSSLTIDTSSCRATPTHPSPKCGSWILAAPCSHATPIRVPAFTLPNTTPGAAMRSNPPYFPIC